jgi:hypothetical protein
MQRQRPMPVRFKSVPFGAPRRQRQHRVESVQRLNSRFLIHTKHSRVLRRIHVQPDDVGGFLLKLRIAASQVAFQPMWFEIRFRQYPLYSGLASAPISPPICGRTSACSHGSASGVLAGSRAIVWSVWQRVVCFLCVVPVDRRFPILQSDSSTRTPSGRSRPVCPRSRDNSAHQPATGSSAPVPRAALP